MSRIDSIRTQAAEWADMLQQRSGDLTLRREFENWCSRDPAHAEAYERIDRAYRLTRAIGGSDVQAQLRSETQMRIHAARRARTHRRRIGMALAASMVLAVAASFTVGGLSVDELRYQQARLGHALAGETLYRTAVGGRRSITLEDGSTITLNTDSRVAVGLHASRREIALLRGQALFEVAHDPVRPFIVQAGARRITALGTAFDVHLTEQSVAVTLIEGRVSVEDVASTQTEPAAAVLLPGDQLLALTSQPKPIVRKADTRRATSWKEGLLLFEGENLAQAIAEVNRYGGPRIELADRDLGDLRISGAFKTGKPDAFLETLSWYLPIRIVEADAQRILVGHKG